MEEKKIDYNENGATAEPQIIEPVAPLPEMSKRSRLNKRIERKSKKTLTLSIIGIIVIFLFLIKFGIPFIADLGFLSSQVAPKNNNSSAEETTKPAFLSTPELSSPFNATNSAQVEIMGSAMSGKQVAIYLNGSLFKKIEVGSDGNFEQKLKLSEGDNIIKAKSGGVTL